MTETQAQDGVGTDAQRVEAPFPDFFIIGAPKCGTTTLYDWLDAHEGVFIPRKELCYFSQDIYPTDKLVSHIPDVSAYRALFSVPEASGKAKGEATPKYLYSDHAFQEIRRLSLRPRLIVCVRDPVDLAISLHSQKVREGWEPEADFTKAWARELKADTPDAARSRPGETNYIFWAHFGARLERLFSLFSRDDILILHLREFRESADEVYARVLRFLELPDDGREFLGASNRRAGLRSPRLNRWILQAHRLVDPALRPLRQIRGGRGFGVLKWVNRFNIVDNAYVSTISDQQREKIYEFLSCDIALAENYIAGSLTEKGPER